MRAELETLEERIGHRFADPELLRRALRHSSLANELRAGPGSPTDDNEQLEFLGDAVLGFLVSEALVLRNPESREGELSRLKAHLVSAAHLHGVARRLDVGRYLELGRSEEMSGGRYKRTLLVDALEALIAAIYLDGGAEPVRRFVAGQVMDAPACGDEEAPQVIADFKSALQELAQSRKLPQPRYSIVRERGPEHSKTFTVEVRAGKEWTGQAEGRTKKVAAQRAAREMYERLLREAAADASPHAAAAPAETILGESGPEAGGAPPANPPDMAES
ncbi:MAG TPA: ribonuclease III [Bryobacteraceae bacterium]|nr:ribonuclease III [Bryobacteraceae bacterium]